jgi:hypothetical protein
MQIGDIVQYQGQRYILRGFTRAGSPQAHAVLEDVETGEWATVPLTEVQPVLREHESDQHAFCHAVMTLTLRGRLIAPDHSP